MEEPKKVIIKANQEMGIVEVLKSFPDSMAFVFSPHYDQDIYYMKLGDPVFTPKDTKYVSVVKIMGFDRLNRFLWFGEYFIPRGVELKAYSCKQLLDMLEESVKILKGRQLEIFRSIGL